MEFDYDSNKCNSTRHNSTFAIGGASCSVDSLAVVESFVLRINIGGKNHAFAKRQTVTSNPAGRHSGR
ncbi:MAG: hypothetical protein QY303_04200 [Vicingaceae bacterium]|nr:hypothetical protein [Flavobacteriales bacterium]WKZ76095.1 MAG: hypothetical protein QY303_04200 [Vicingaceae bacterium]